MKYPVQDVAELLGADFSYDRLGAPAKPAQASLEGFHEVDCQRAPWVFQRDAVRASRLATAWSRRARRSVKPFTCGARIERNVRGRRRTGVRMRMIADPSGSAVRRLLSEAGLPTSDLTPEKLKTFFACESDGALVGVVGLELLGTVGLLRSLVVSPHSRSRGLGSALVAHAEGVARARGVACLYLLTTTAESFFGRLGYEKVPRQLAPPEIQTTSEFSGVCPVSAACMLKRLPAPEVPK